MEMMMRAKLVKPANATNKEFFSVWLAESKAAIAALDAGVIKHIWKAAGKYEVIAVFEFENGDQIDAAVHQLPIWVQGFAHVVEDIEWIPLRPYRNWGKQLEDLAKG
jgi:muconolactone delta-isomerase